MIALIPFYLMPIMGHLGKFVGFILVNLSDSFLLILAKLEKCASLHF